MPLDQMMMHQHNLEASLGVELWKLRRIMQKCAYGGLQIAKLAGTDFSPSHHVSDVQRIPA
jgi:hypothetical protein